ncbi:MAG: hypothetical protein H6917_16075 [Novosphingobium sp.]|nr:hypothetical protein [Novosphingobium sp.]MCP5403889.1 hypothetical protein [Novosphingobium sp.]
MLKRKSRLIRGKAAPAAADAAGKAKARLKAAPLPSPVPQTNLILADILLRGGNRLLRRGVERGLLTAKYSSNQADKLMKKRTLLGTLATTALARVATRSVPGAIVVGGGLLAKTLYDRRKAREEAANQPPPAGMGDWEADESDDDEA